MFDYGYKDTAVFSYFQIFLNFFLYFFFVVCNHTYICRFPALPVFLLFRRCVSGGVFFSCRLWSPDNHMHAHIYARIYARTRGFLDYKFLDISVIFRLYRNF